MSRARWVGLKTENPQLVLWFYKETKRTQGGIQCLGILKLGQHTELQSPCHKGRHLVPPKQKNNKRRALFGAHFRPLRFGVTLRLFLRAAFQLLKLRPLRSEHEHRNFTGTQHGSGRLFGVIQLGPFAKQMAGECQLKTGSIQSPKHSAGRFLAGLLDQLTSPLSPPRSEGRDLGWTPRKGFRQRWSGSL